MVSNIEKVSKRAVVTAILPLGLALSHPGLAQQTDPNSPIEEIIITASKTGAQSLQEAPFSVSAFTGEDLERSVVRDVRDLVASTPSLAISENTGFAQVFMRGVGSNNVFAGSDPSVTIHTDGVYVARPSAYVGGFLGVERVEVLRGPQGTLYGRNSVGGTINIISRRPSDELEGSAQVDVGNYNLVRAQGYIAGPIVPDVANASISVLRSTHDHYFDNIISTGNDIDNEDTFGTKGQVLLTPSQNLELIIRGDYLSEQPDVAGYSKLLEARGSAGDVVLGNFRKVALNFPQFAERKTGGAALEANWQLSDDVTLKSLSAWRKLKYTAQIDSDASDPDLLHTFIPERQHQYSEELNLIGKWQDVKYVLGAYYFTETIDYPLRVQNVVAGTESRSSPHVETESVAVYGQADIPLGASFSAQVGARYSDETKKLDQIAGTYSIATGALTSVLTQYSTKRDYKAFTPRVGIEFKPTDEVMLYGFAARGFKSGGFVNSSLDPLQGFGPEKLWSYELGAKTEWLDRRLTLNLAAFYYDYKDLQVNFFLRPGVTDIRNAATAKVKGVEAELHVAPTTGLEIGTTVSLLNAEYDDFPSAPLRNNVGSFNAAGKRLNDAPAAQVNPFINQDFEVGGDWLAYYNASASWTSRSFFTPQNTSLESQGAYWIVNGSVGVRSADDQLSFSVWARNLTDTKYITGTASFASARVAARVGSPQTYGIQVRYKY